MLLATIPAVTCNLRAWHGEHRALLRADTSFLVPMIEQSNPPTPPCMALAPRGLKTLISSFAFRPD